MAATTFSIDGFTVRWDGSYNWLVERPITRKSKQGEEYAATDVLGYYSNLESALIGIFRYEQCGIGPSESARLAAELRTIEKRLITDARKAAEKMGA